MSIISNYNKALQDLYKHVGFKEDWVVCPIDDQTDCFWSVDVDKNGGGSVKFAETMEKFNSDGDYYLDDIYTQRFYDKWVYRGEKYTMVFYAFIISHIYQIIHTMVWLVRCIQKQIVSGKGLETLVILKKCLSESIWKN